MTWPEKILEETSREKYEGIPIEKTLWVGLLPNLPTASGIYSSIDDILNWLFESAPPFLSEK